MNRKLRVLSLLGIMMLFAGSAFASYIDQLTNQSAEWIGNPTRLAATDSVDCVTYNPAGTSMMPDGLHVHLSNQSIDNNNTTKVEDPAYTGLKEYETHKPSKVVPAFYTNFKHGSWAIYGGAHIVGGGGSTLWENGTPNLNQAVENVDTMGILGWDGATANNLYWDSTKNNAGNVSVEMKSMFPALTLGGSVAINDMVSVSLGGRVVDGSQSIKIQVSESGTGGDLGKDTVYNGEWTALGYTGIIGVDVKPVKELNLTATYESLTKMEWEVNVEKDKSRPSALFGGTEGLSAISGYIDGREFRFDLPAKAMFGAEYAVVPSLKLSLAGMMYMTNWGTYNKPTKSTAGTGAQNEITYKLDNAYEIGAGFDWQFLKNISWTAGVNYDRMNMKSSDLNELMNKIDLYNIGTGLKIRTDENLNIMVSYMRNIYISETNTATANAAGTPTYKTEYSKYANVLAFSFEYKIF